jgi:hypothetical protein
MFPGIESVDQATQAMRHLRYPPDGDRGVATYNRAYGFGLHPERLETANERVLGIVQVESRLAVERVEEITKVPGIHVLFIGPRDLSHDLGVPGDTSAPVFQEALQRVLTAAEEAGLAAGILAPDAETARRYANLGLRFIGIGSDATLLASPANTPSTASVVPTPLTLPDHPLEFAACHVGDDKLGDVHGVGVVGVLDPGRRPQRPLRLRALRGERRPAGALEDLLEGGVRLCGRPRRRSCTNAWPG